MINPRVAAKIVEFEMGNLTELESVELIAELTKDGIVWQLQGMYGRMAKRLIEAGVITLNGEVDYSIFDGHKHQEF